jgi:hypothetical protein
MCRRLTVLLGGHRRALQGGCLLAALPSPLLADIVNAAVDLDTCRIEIDMTVGASGNLCVMARNQPSRVT